MSIIKVHMERDPKVRVAYSDAYFNLSNYADFAKWETKCLRRFDVAATRASEEARLRGWIESDSVRKATYGAVLADLERGYKGRCDAGRNLEYFRETWFGASEALLMGNRVASFLGKLDRMKRDTFDITAEDAQNVLNNKMRLCRNYDPATDRDLLAKMVGNFTRNVPREMWGKYLQQQFDATGGDAGHMAREAFDASFCSDPERYEAFFSKNRSVAEIRRDPLVVLSESVKVQRFTGGVDKAEERACACVKEYEALYTEALYKFREAQGIVQYPNANSTLRLTYGTVGGITPSDGVHYDSRSTIKGYSEKCNPAEYEFRVDDKMRSLIAKKDWGRWGENGQLYVNFLTNNDITGVIRAARCSMAAVG